MVSPAERRRINSNNSDCNHRYHPQQQEGSMLLQQQRQRQLEQRTPPPHDIAPKNNGRVYSKTNTSAAVTPTASMIEKTAAIVTKRIESLSYHRHRQYPYFNHQYHRHRQQQKEEKAIISFVLEPEAKVLLRLAVFRLIAME